MKCPLSSYVKVMSRGDSQLDWLDCLKEECAWWQKELGNCIIYQISMFIGVLALEVDDIKIKMPHEAQFRK